MTGIFPGGLSPVMTTDAVSAYSAVIEGCRVPVSCRMTNLAIVTTGDVIRVLAHRDAAVVTTDTATYYLGVINPGHW